MTGTIGFIGLGLMGGPMARRLVDSGLPLIVWNRTRTRTHELRAAGAVVAESPAEVFREAGVIFEMLANEAAIDAVLGPRSPRFRHLVAGRTLVHMSTTAPQYSRRLEVAVRGAGGRYVEAPVSGSRIPARNGELVGMLAGDASTVEAVRPLFAPMCRDTFDCGPVPGALVTKLAINLYLIAMVTGLAEAVQFASSQGVELALLQGAIASGPMASAVAAVKLEKLVGSDFGAQASAADVLVNCELIADAVASAGVASPLLGVCRDLFAETVAMGDGAQDMVAVIRALESRTRSRSDAPIGRG